MLVLNSRHCVSSKYGDRAGRHGREYAASLFVSETAQLRKGVCFPSPHRAVPQQRRLSVSAAHLVAADLDAGQLTLPVLEIIVLAGTWIAARLALGFRITYVTAAMLSRTVPKGARVLQLGGTVKELYYYPGDTVLVSVAARKLNRGLWEQAGMQAGVPVQTQQTDRLPGLAFQASESVDAVVSLGMLSGLAPHAQRQLAASVARVLKPGGVFLFVERGDFGGAASLVQKALQPASPRVGREALDAMLSLPEFEDASYDVALAGVDVHAVGLARKARSADGSKDRSRATSAGRQRAPKGFA